VVSVEVLHGIFKEPTIWPLKFKMAEVFAVGWVLCVRRQTEHESVMLLLSLSSLNVLTH